MRQGESNPLQRELARVQQAGTHPDSDLLTAFAEGSLLEREREEVFAHLARCAECRELLNVASGAADNPVAESKPFLITRPTRTTLRRWIPSASIAAGIVLVSTVGLLYRQRMEVKEPTAAGNTARSSAANHSLTPISAEPEAASTPDGQLTAKKLKGAQPAPGTGPRASSGGTPAGELKQAAARDNRSQTETAGAQAAREDLDVQQQAQVQHQAQSQVQAEVHTQAQSLPAPAFAPTAPNRALSKSGPAAALLTRPRWRIDRNGMPERSMSAGVWQKIVPDETAKIKVVSILNEDVWMGGESTRLYHSTDNGNTWKAIVLPAKGAPSHVIVHIRFKTRQVGTVEADDGTSWTTTDGGASWN
jgi:hypothetical protein